MDWTPVLVAGISALGMFAGTTYGIKKSSDITIYRIDRLEEKVDKHNRVIERVYKLEQWADDHDDER